ncbi:MAG: hypothetical protein KDD26_03915 [Winogradskyella sp.]|nr:hypothetical protein [Winogradskyella sp.]
MINLLNLKENIGKIQFWVMAFVINQFIGWGGLQPENGNAGLEIVLNPDYLGLGKIIYT